MNSLKKTIYLTRHGQSEYNLTGQLGGNSGLSEKGKEYSEFIYNYFKNYKIENIQVITSGMKRTNMTAELFKNKTINDKFEEINAGIYEHYTYDQIKKENIEEFNKRKNNKFNYKYPDGESYKDLQDRIIPEFKKLIETNDTFLLVAHNAVLRIIFGYLHKLDDNEIPHLEVALNTIFKIEIFENREIKKTIISYN